MASAKGSGKSIQGGVIDDLLNDLDFIVELLTLPPYAGPRHNFEARMMQKEWEKMYSGEIKKRRALRDLRKKKWVTDRKKGEEIIVSIHSDAVVAALKDRIHSIRDRLTKGDVCLISFDFPNSASTARNQWRFMIKKFGFDRVQLSLYATEFDVFDEVQALVKVLGAERWVKVYRANES